MKGVVVMASDNRTTDYNNIIAQHCNGSFLGLCLAGEATRKNPVATEPPQGWPSAILGQERRVRWASR